MVDKILRSLLVLYAAVFLVHFFLPVSYLPELSYVILLLILALALPTIRKVNRNVCLTFFLLGVAAFAYTGTSPHKMLAALGQNGGLVALYLFVPIMGMPFFYENYQGELGKITRRYTTSVLPFLLFIQLSTYFLALVIYMGCFIILYSLFAPKAKEYNCQALFRVALLQGYAAAGFWGPSWASAAIVTSRLHINWLDILLPGFVFSLLALSVTALLLWHAVAKNPARYPRVAKDLSVEVDWRKVKKLVLLAASLVGLVLAVNYLTRWSMYIIVPIVAFPYAVGAALLQDKLPDFRANLSEYYHNKLYTNKAEYCLFIVGGFLGTALEYTGVGAVAPSLLPTAVLSSPILVAFLLIAMVVLMAVVGVHPVVIVPSIALAIAPASVGLNVLSFAMVLLAGWLLGVNISPFSAGTMIMAGLEQKTPWEIGPYSNYKFVFIMTVVFALAAGCLHWLTI